MQYDAIVIGAGPAGSTAARNLARSGCSTLLLEKESLGRDKPCGGGLTARSYTNLDVPIEDLVLSKMRGAELRAGGKRLAHVRAEKSAIWMVQRREFDKRLVLAAVEQGVDLRENEPASSLSQDPDGVSVLTSQGEYRAKSLLIAAGAESKLRREAGFANLKRVNIAAIEIEGRATSCTLDGTQALLDYRMRGGYFWVFPKGNVWNVGVGSVRPEAGPYLRKQLARFMTQLDLRFLDSGGKVKGRRIPVWPGMQTLHNGRIALLGDSAGLADPFFAEGISGALASGRLAAEAVREMIASGEPNLVRYTERLQRLLARHMRRTTLLYRLVGPAPTLWMRALDALPFTQGLAERVVSGPYE